MRRRQDWAVDEGCRPAIWTGRVTSCRPDREVIRGDWGNGVERKKKLNAAGYRYDDVQKKVRRVARNVAGDGQLDGVRFPSR